MENQNKEESVDKNRRKLLVVMLIGSGAFLVEKFSGPLLSIFLNNSPAKSDLPAKTDFSGFRVTEDKKILSVYDDSGEEIFQIDKKTY